MLPALNLRPCSGSLVPGQASPPMIRMEHVHTHVRVGPVLLGAVDPQVRDPGFTLMSFLPRSLCTTAIQALTHHENAHSAGQAWRGSLTRCPASRARVSWGAGEVGHLHSPDPPAHGALLRCVPRALEVEVLAGSRTQVSASPPS